MGAMPSGPEDLGVAIAEAVAAFDVANHAFGRFVTYVVRPHGEAIPRRVQVVREGFQEAALSVPQTPSVEAAAEFLAALRAARDRLAAFLTDPGAEYRLEEALAAPEALAEAIEILEAALAR